MNNSEHSTIYNSAKSSSTVSANPERKKTPATYYSLRRFHNAPHDKSNVEFDRVADRQDDEVYWLEYIGHTLDTTTMEIRRFIEDRRGLNGFSPYAIAHSSHWRIIIYKHKARDNQMKVSGFVTFTMRAEDGVPKIAARLNELRIAVNMDKNMNKSRFGFILLENNISVRCPDNEFTLEGGSKVIVRELCLQWDDRDEHTHNSGDVALVKFTADCATNISEDKTSCRNWLNIASDLAEKLGMRIIEAIIKLADLTLDDVELNVINKKVSYP